MKRAWITLALVAGFLLGTWLGPWFRQEDRRLSSDVVLEQVQTVLRLITVEGRFSEIYDYQDYWGYDIGPLRKKILLRVSGRVQVGFDLKETEFQIEEEEKRVRIEQWPEPAIQSIDMEVDYYDISEGTFNSFSEEDFTRFQKEARDLIRQRAMESDLREQARDQRDRLAAALNSALSESGWSLRF